MGGWAVAQSPILGTTITVIPKKQEVIKVCSNTTKK